MKVGEEIEVKILQVNEDGDGLGSFNGHVVYVSDAFTGKTVRAKIKNIRGKVVYAELINVVSDGEDKNKQQ